MLKAPEGHCATWLISVWPSANSGLIHGLSFGRYTLGKSRTQFPEWMQLSGFHTMVTSPFEYSLVIMTERYSIRWVSLEFEGEYLRDVPPTKTQNAPPVSSFGEIGRRTGARSRHPNFSWSLSAIKSKRLWRGFSTIIFMKGFTSATTCWYASDPPSTSRIWM